MNPIHDIKKLAKKMVKLTIETEKCDPKHKIKLARILKKAFNVETKMKTSLGVLFPLLSDKETDRKAYEIIDSATKYMVKRTGRQIQCDKQKEKDLCITV